MIQKKKRQKKVKPTASVFSSHLTNFGVALVTQAAAVSSGLIIVAGGYDARAQGIRLVSMGRWLSGLC